MSIFGHWHKLPSRWALFGFLIVLYLVVSAAIRFFVPPPAAVALEYPPRTVEDVQFFNDASWIDETGGRQLSQTLFDAVFEGIRAAKNIIVIDMFLFNQWQGPVPETHRALASELTDVLVEQQQKHPDMDIVVISDPINTVYGGTESAQFERLKAAGVHVVLTRLDQLQDSNPFWSGIWRALAHPWGNSTGDLLPNPFGAGRVSIRSYLTLFNFKANHRKLMIADNQGEDLHGWVSSANPHDGSSAHRNIALRFSGAVVLDLLNSERELLKMSDSSHLLPSLDQAVARLERVPKVLAKDSVEDDGQTALIQVVSESKIHEALIRAIDSALKEDEIDLAMFYLSERHIIQSLKLAAERGVRIRVLLDVNNDAFGRAKNGVPNRPVAAELMKAGVQVRWCVTQGEQCHAKWLHVKGTKMHEFFVGSANFTRRNLMDLNLETDIRLVVGHDAPIATQMTQFFETQWNNTSGRRYSTHYDDFADDSVWLTIQYRLMEMTGLSTF